MRVLNDFAPEPSPVVTGVLYAYSDRRNGWYCYAHNDAGDQIGDAIYMYQKADVLSSARELAAEHGSVPVVRG